MVAVTEIDLPSGWVRRTADERSRKTIAEYKLESEEGTTFTVVVRRPSDVEEYGLRLSTAIPESKYKHHSYPVQEYETRTAALEGAEAFIEHLSTRFREGSLSRDDPGIEATRAAIRDFTGHSSFPSIRRLVRILRR